MPIRRRDPFEPKAPRAFSVPVERRPSTFVPAKPLLNYVTTRVALPTLAQPTVDLFAVSVVGLSPAELAQPGWCVRVSVPGEVPTTPPPPLANEDKPFVGYPMQGLICELTFAVQGEEQTIEVDAYPGFALHIAADVVRARLRWSWFGQAPPEGMFVHVQVTRGLCPTTATRSYFLFDTLATGPYNGQGQQDRIPFLATRWGLYIEQGALADDPNKTLGFYQTVPHEAGVIQQTLDAEMLDAIEGGVAFPRVPPNAAYWKWEPAAEGSYYRLVFFYSEAFG